MKLLFYSLNKTLRNLVKCIFKSKEERMSDEVEFYERKYEKYGIVKLRNLLTGYKSKVQQSQLLLTGIMLVVFTALLGGLGQSILRWIRQLLIINTSATLKKAQALSKSDLQTVLFIEFFIILIIILILILGIVFFVDKIKTMQMKILVLESIFEKKTKSEKS
ncbi:hypothetical protein [Lactobacillus johnsonii]|jgi:hypothetical protein|nr:hypothetical protein [Lactobacillus johnsonii]